jgi:hypothetical protein
MDIGYLNRILKTGDITQRVYTLPKNYRGPQWFLTNTLVHQSQNFIQKLNNKIILTKFGEDLCKSLLDDDDKYFGIVRLCGKGKLSSLSIIKEAIDIFLKEKYKNTYNPRVVFNIIDISCENAFYWDKKIPQAKLRGVSNWMAYVDEAVGNDRNFEDGGPIKFKYILLLNQCCSRSTNVAFHEKIKFWCDDRSNSTPGSTYEQAIFRVCHYAEKDVNDHDCDIQVYCDPLIFQVGAGNIPYTTRKSCAKANKNNKSINQITYTISKKYIYDSQTHHIIQVIDDNGNIINKDHGTSGPQGTIRISGTSSGDKNNPLLGGLADIVVYNMNPGTNNKDNVRQLIVIDREYQFNPNIPGYGKNACGDTLKYKNINLPQYKWFTTPGTTTPRDAWNRLLNSKDSCGIQYKQYDIIEVISTTIIATQSVKNSMHNR